MLVCPGCDQEVHARQPHFRVQRIAWSGIGKAMFFHNETCLKNWLDKPVKVAEVLSEHTPIF